MKINKMFIPTLLLLFIIYIEYIYLYMISDWGKVTLAVRDTDVSRHYEAQFRALLKLTDTAYCCDVRGVSGWCSHYAERH